MRELDRCDFCEDPADGVYEVVPDTAPSGARRLVLCAACRDTLAGVVDPLLDALDADGTDAGDHAHSPAVTVEPAVPNVELDDETDGGDDREAGDATDVDSDATASVADNTDEADNVDDTDEADNVDDTDAADEVDETDTGPASDRPRGYAQLVRLLRNRPDAMTRTDLAELASGAYDLSPAEVKTAVDAAVENGHLEETAQGLRTP